MADTSTLARPEILAAFAGYERRVRISNYKVGCLLAFIFMPAGASLDYFVYNAPGDSHVWEFFKLRLFCSGLLAVVYGLLCTELGARVYRALGFLVAFLPMAFISWMIFATDGPASPYYAGLNLVMLGAAILLRWTLTDSILVFVLSTATYLAACNFSGKSSPPGVFYNNFYFLFVTGVFIITGSWFYNRIRFREFALRHQLDESKQQLEENNVKLDLQNKELADTIQKLTEAESQLVQSEKMASLGRMSAGIIHEINNPLNFATTGLFTLKKKTKHVAADQQAEYEDILKDVEDGITRVKNIVSDLRLFTHPSTDNLDQVAAEEVVASALRFLSNELKGRIAIEINLPDHQLVRTNKNKLIHVFVNLIQNSIDALSLRTFAAGEKPTIWIEGRVDAESSRLVVRDNGPGISSDHLGKIFDPFFTTKEVGEGMGLGLSICYRIVQESQGRILVRTEPGKFCEFTLEFPTKL
jgi:two-component system, sensor histidine kinase PhcS